GANREREKNDLHAQQPERLLRGSVHRYADEPRNRDDRDRGCEHDQAAHQPSGRGQAAEKDQRQREREAAEADAHPADRHDRSEDDRVGGGLIDRVPQIFEADEEEEHGGGEEQEPRPPRRDTPDEIHSSSGTGSADLRGARAPGRSTSRTAARTFSGCRRTRKSVAWLIHRTLPSASISTVVGMAM